MAGSAEQPARRACWAGSNQKEFTLHISRIRARIATAALAVAATIIAVNVAIVSAVPVTRQLVDEPQPEPLPGITHLRAVDDRVWRGDAPSTESYGELAAHGVTTVVDLRAERDIEVPLQVIAATGLRRVHIPVRDGQTPTPDQVAHFLAVVRDAPGRVYLHCGAGVGRTGTMSAAYLVHAADTDGAAALSRNIAVGPPSVEQIWYAATLEPGSFGQPPAVVSAVSRVLDGPRRVWSRLV